MKPHHPIPLFLLVTALLVGALGIQTLHAQHPPPIAGEPIYFDAGMLPWPTDRPPAAPDLTEPTSNRIYDLHMEVKDCAHFGLIVSTAGNWHPALTDYWYGHFLRKQKGLQNWYFTTTPPIAQAQSNTPHFGIGNVSLGCKPHIAIGPMAEIEVLTGDGLAEGEAVNLLESHGNVLLVRRGNPKNIRTIHDLGRRDVVVVTPHPQREAGSFALYTNSLYGITYHAFGRNIADTLFARVFQSNDSTWVAGSRIHHRELPEIIARGDADVGLFMYHLARYVCATFPEYFDMIPLGGGIQSPDPLPGNQRLTLYAIRIKGGLSPSQETYREAFFEDIEKGRLEKYLRRHHLIPAGN